MGWDVLQSNSTPATATAVDSVACSYLSNVQAATKLVAYVATSTQTGTTDEVATVKDAAGNSWTLVGRRPQGSPNVLCDVSAWALDTPAGDAGAKPALTATLSGGTAAMGMLIQEISGLAAGNTLAEMIDGTLASLGGNGGSSTGSPAYTSTALDELMVSVYGDDGGPETWTKPAALTADAKSVNTSSDSNIAVAYGNSTNGAESASWGLSGSPADWGTLLVAFKLASATITGTFSLAMAPRGLAFTGKVPVSGTFALAIAGRGLALTGKHGISGTFALAMAPRALAFTYAAKLLMSLASKSGTDPAGNPYPAGVSVGEPGGQQAQLLIDGNVGKLAFPSGLSGESQKAGALAGVGGTSPTEYIQLVVGGASVTAALSQVYEEWNSAGADGSGHANWQHVYADESGNTYALASGDNNGWTIPAGKITAQHPGAAVPTAESWQVMTLANSFTDGEFGPSYKLLSESGMLAFHGQLILPSTFNGVVFTTLPAAYRPTFGSGVSVRWPVSCQSSTSVAGYAELGSDGTIKLWGASFAATDLVDITGVTFIS